MTPLSNLQLSSLRADLARASLVIGKRHGVSLQIGEIDDRHPAPPCDGSELFTELSAACSVISKSWGVALQVADIVSTKLVVTNILSPKSAVGSRLRRVHFSIG